LAKIYDAVTAPLRSLDKRFKVVLAAIGVYNGANSLTLNYNRLYAVALGANPVELGSLNSLGSVISSAFSVPAGWLIGKYGVKNMLVTGLALCELVSALYVCATSWLTLLPAVMLAQLGFKILNVARAGFEPTTPRYRLYIYHLQPGALGVHPYFLPG